MERSIKAEVHLDCNHHWHWLPAIHHRRSKPVFADRFESLLVQSHPQSANHSRILRVSLLIHNHLHQANALVLGPPRLIG